MDKFLKYKQIAFKLGIPILVLIFIIFILIGINSGKDKNNKDTNKVEMSLFKEDELVATRYSDSIEDKLNAAVSSQDNLKSDNERMKKELEALKGIVSKEEKNRTKSSPQERNDLYDDFPKIPGILDTPKDNSGENNKDTTSKSKILYKYMNQQNEQSIDVNFGKTQKKTFQETIEKLYLPTTSISTGSLLHGLNAPTSMSKPMPTVVMIKDVAFLPNRKKFNIRECNLLVEGYGQLSDERAYFKFVQFVCIDENGKKIYDTKASGYLTSLVDNKQGLPGHVVSKQDAMLGRMFLAGTFEGAGDMFKNTGQTQITSPFVTTTSQSMNNSDRATNLLGSGLSTASESAKNLYLEKARNISETVEILAQDVGLVFTDGLILEPLDLEKKAKGNANEKVN